MQTDPDSRSERRSTQPGDPRRAQPGDQRRAQPGDQRGAQPPPTPVVKRGLKQMIGPMVAGIAIDGLDLMTFGPIGLYAGLILGGAVGYWLAPMLGFPPKGRWLAALMTGIYCTIPLTGFIPAAAVAAGLTRALSRGNAAPVETSADPALRPEGSIDVEFESKEIDPKTRRPR